MSDGIGCKCAARCEAECCCEDVSWEPKEIQTARFKIAELTLRVNKLEAALRSIASNTCCGDCQEARRVAEKAMK